MKQRFLKYIANNGLFNKNDNILVAVSGGLDSVVLLDLLLKTGFNISIAHCNFQLRGDESDADEEFVETLGRKHGINTYVNTCNADTYAKRNNLSIQESARELRYEWFKKILTENKFDKLAVAHHFDDNLETFFINFSRGSGLSGLKGIPVKNDKMVRPLMFATRNEIADYAVKFNIDFREDSSNASDKYLRNNLRHNLLPVLHKILGGSNETLQKSMLYLAEDEMLFNQLMQQKRDEVLKEENNQIVVSIPKLLLLHPLGPWVYYLLKPFGFKRALTDDISLAIQEGVSGKTFFSSTHRLVTDREKLLIGEIQEISHGRFVIGEKETKVDEPINLNISIFNRLAGFKIKKDSNIAYFDFDKLKFPLVLRKWEKGDRFYPFGMKGSKLVSDFFIDQKLNLIEKEKIWLLISGEEIIWVVGMRASGRFKILGETMVVYQIKQTR